MAGVLTLNLVLQKSKVDDIRRIQKLNICAAQLQDIGVLRQASNLEVLSMSLNEIVELGAVSNCRRLTELYLRKNFIRDINQVLHLSRLPYLEVLNLSDNPISRDPNYRRFVIAAVPSLERLDDRDITDEERDDALSVFPQLLSFAPPPSRYAEAAEGYQPPTVQERQAQAQARVGGGRSAPSGTFGGAAAPASRQNTDVSHAGRGGGGGNDARRGSAASNNAPIRKSPPAHVHQDPRAAPPQQQQQQQQHHQQHPQRAAAAHPPPQAPPTPAARARAVNDYPSSASVVNGPSEEGVVQAVKVLCSELSLEALEEVQRFIDSMTGY